MRTLLLGLALLASLDGAAHAENQPGVLVGRGEQLWMTLRPPLVRFELGMSERRTQLGALSGTDDDGPSGYLPMGGPITARGATLRALVGFRGVYVGIEGVTGRVIEAPVVLAPLVKRASEQGSGSMRGLLFEVGVPVGVERRYGRLMIGGEVALGVGGVTLGGPETTDPFVSDVRILLDARARGGVWLTSASARSPASA